jgi:hypothetical protein
MKLPSYVRSAISKRISHAVSRIDPLRYRQEPNYIAALFAKLDDVIFDGKNLTIELRSTIVDDRGYNSAESIWGADFALTTSINMRGEQVEKGAIGQGKKNGLAAFHRPELERLRTQVVKMSKATHATLVLEVPAAAGVMPTVLSVFPIPSLAEQPRPELFNGKPGDHIVAIDPHQPSVLVGQKWTLDDYICNELIACSHGDRRPEFLKGIRSSNLMSLAIEVTEKQREGRRRVSLDDDGA